MFFSTVAGRIKWVHTCRHLDLCLNLLSTQSALIIIIMRHWARYSMLKLFLFLFSHLKIGTTALISYSTYKYLNKIRYRDTTSCLAQHRCANFECFCVSATENPINNDLNLKRVYFCHKENSPEFGCFTHLVRDFRMSELWVSISAITLTGLVLV